MPIQDIHIVMNDKEAKLIKALVTSDIGHKELASDMHITTQELSKILTKVRIRNNFMTNDAMLRSYAIQLYIQQLNEDKGVLGFDKDNFKNQ